MNRARAKRSIVAVGVPAIVALLAVLSLVLWRSKHPIPELALRVPDTDMASVKREPEEPWPIQGQLVQGSGTPSDLPGAWPRFRGSAADGIDSSHTPLNEKWDTDGPPLLWSAEMGEGYAGAAVLEGRVYVLDYDRENQADVLRCMSLADGADIWRYSYPVKIKRNHGMSRTIPAVTEKYAVALGPKCHVTCLDAKSGRLLWMLHLVREFGAKVPPWYAGQCPLIDDDKAILAPAGKDLMIAVDCATGDVVWRTPNPRNWRMSHSSIVPVTIDGVRTYVYCASGGVAGVSAADGALLWTTEDWQISIATIPSPVPVGDDRLLLTGGYNAGALMLEVRREGTNWETRVLYRLDADVFGSDQQTPILHQGYVYAVRPRGQMVCFNPATGEVLWDSGAHRFGLGPYLVADGRLLIMNDDGRLTLARATPEAFIPLAEAQVLHGHDSWAPMAMAAGRLIVRDMTRMVCLNVSRPGHD